VCVYAGRQLLNGFGPVSGMQTQKHIQQDRQRLKPLLRRRGLAEFVTHLPPG
jgi:hypothetical protein